MKTLQGNRISIHVLTRESARANRARATEQEKQTAICLDEPSLSGLWIGYKETANLVLVQGEGANSITSITNTAMNCSHRTLCFDTRFFLNTTTNNITSRTRVGSGTTCSSTSSSAPRAEVRRRES
eukprot:2379762-Rhodomonas_salina.2